MFSRTGANTNCEHPGDDHQAIADKLVAMGSPFQLLLDDYIDTKWFFTKQLKARSPVTKPIHRRYWYVDPHSPRSGGWDGSLHRAPGITASGIINTLEAQQRAGGVFPVIEQIYNEPDVHRNEQDPNGLELQTKNKLIVDCIHYAATRGIGLVVDNAQEQSINLAEVDAGFYDEMIITLCMYPNMRMGIHKYGLGALMGNISNEAIGKLTTPGAFSYASWRVFDDNDNLLLGNLNSQRVAYIAHAHESHLVAGSYALAQRAKLLRKKPENVDKMRYPFEIVATECWWDHVILGDSGSITRVVDNLNNRPAMGYPTLWRYWSLMFQDEHWTPAQAAYEQVRWMDAVEIPECVGLCGYTLDTQFESGRYHLDIQ